MGLIHKGIPEKLATELAQKHHCKTFIETGTHVGRTARWAFDSRLFQAVHTIEAVREYQQRAKTKFLGTQIKLHSGNSQKVLPNLVWRINGSVLFWLDAHWSRDLEGVKPVVVCPVMREIAAINMRWRDDVILVDDARLFGVDVGWPALGDVKRLLEAEGRRQVYVQDDVVVAVPK